MPENAESHASALTTNRNCVMEITNVSSTYCLCNPKYESLLHTDSYIYSTQDAAAGAEAVVSEL